LELEKLQIPALTRSFCKYFSINFQAIFLVFIFGNTFHGEVSEWSNVRFIKAYLLPIDSNLALLLFFGIPNKIYAYSNLHFYTTHNQQLVLA
jgi:hypothetical protein